MSILESLRIRVRIFLVRKTMKPKQEIQLLLVV